MIADTVVVVVQPLDDRANFAIIDACNRALGETRCVLTASSSAVQPSATLGQPEVSLPITRVRVALSSAALERAAVAFEAGGVLGPARMLEFADTDPLDERYRAIGLVIAARLFEEAAARRDRPPPRASPPPPPPGGPKRLGLETALFLGQGLDEGDLRWGLRTRALARPVRDIPVSVLLGMRLGLSSSDDEQSTMRWTTLSCGLQGSVPIVSELLFFELHAEGALQFVYVAIEDAVTGAKDDGSETRYGTILGAQLAWSPFDFWSLFIGAESALTWPPLLLEVRRAEVAKEDPLRLSAHIGQRLSF
jgi:hypothetical protein